MPSGPCQGSAFFSTIRAAGFFSTYDNNNELFQWFFDELCIDMGSGPLDYGSDRHMAEVWERCKSSSVLHKKGKRVRMGRWWSLFAACQDVQGEEDLLLLIPVYVGMRENVWTSIWRSPLCKASLPQEPEPGGVEGEEPAEAVGAAVQAADTAPGGRRPQVQNCQRV